MADGQRVTLEAVFKSSGLDRLGRQFDLVNEKMRRMGSAMRSWGQGGGGPDMGKQFEQGAMANVQRERIGRLSQMWQDTYKKLNGEDDAGKRKVYQNQLDRITRLGKAEMVAMEMVNRGSAETGAKVMSRAWLLRGLRVGAGALGLPLSMAAIGRQMGEAGEQEKMIGPMALRIREVNGPIKDFSEYTMDLRKNIVAAGAEFAFSGRESLALADSLSKMSGGLVDMKTVFEGARGLGIAPQAAGQALALARRLGGRDAQNPGADEKMMHSLGKAISSSGMMPRGEEFVQTLAQAMQTYSTRLPAVSPDTLMGIFSALSNDRSPNSVGRLAPTLRGQGGLQVTQGLTSMMDDMSEAMVAIQTEIVSRNPQAFKKTANQLGIDVSGGVSGGDRYALVTALKQAGVADADGLKLAGRTIKEVTAGLDKGTRIAVESQLLRLSPQIVAALEKGGFMDRLTKDEIGFDDFKKTVDRLSGNAGSAMDTPGMQFAHMGRSVGAHMTNRAEQALKTMSDYLRPGTIGEMMDEGTSMLAVPGLMTLSAGERLGASSGKNQRRWGGAAIGAGLGFMAGGPIGLGIGALAGAFGPGMQAGLAGMGRGADFLAEGAGRMSSLTGRQVMDITVHIAGTANPAMAAILVAERLGAEIMKLAHQTGNNVKVQGAQSPNADRNGR